MSKGTVNKVLLIGNLGADPEVRQSPGGTVVATLNLATTDSRKDQTGNWQEHTEWHRVTVFGRTAEVARDYLRKGGKVFVEGRLQTRKWQDKNGQDRYTTEVVANELQMLDRAGGGQGPSEPRERSGGYAPPPPGPAQRAPEPGFPSGGGMDDFDDDIPF
jgi:single-strand DNA-binding protein